MIFKPLLHFLTFPWITSSLSCYKPNFSIQPILNVVFYFMINIDFHARYVPLTFFIVFVCLNLTSLMFVCYDRKYDFNFLFVVIYCLRMGLIFCWCWVISCFDRSITFICRRGCFWVFISGGSLFFYGRDESFVAVRHTIESSYSITIEDALYVLLKSF